MIAVDTNLLVYAHREDAPLHAQAANRIKQLAEGRQQWAIPWPCIHEFIGIVTRPRIYSPPTPLAVALDTVTEWTKSPTLVLLSEGEAYWGRLRQVLEASQIIGPAVHDAHIAAICLYHGVTELWTADRDFSRFPELKLRNPLIGRKAEVDGDGQDS